MSKELTASQKRSLAMFDRHCDEWVWRHTQSPNPIHWSTLELAWKKGREQGRKMERKELC